MLLSAMFGSDFVSWIFIKNIKTFLEVKIDINQVNLTPCQAHWVLWKMPLGGAKDEHFSCFHSSCQLGLWLGAPIFLAHPCICSKKVVDQFSMCELSCGRAAFIRNARHNNANSLIQKAYTAFYSKSTNEIELEFVTGGVELLEAVLHGYAGGLIFMK